MMFEARQAASSKGVGDAYDDLYSARWLDARVTLASWVLRHLSTSPGQSLLDVACGTGELCAVAQQSGLSAFGIDISKTAVQHSTGARVGKVVGDGMRLPYPNNSFDRVTSIGSLEHYENMLEGVIEISRVLAKDGQSLILVPNAFGLTWNLLRVWRTGGLADDDHQPIQRFGTLNSWIALLTEGGLHVRRVISLEQLWPRTRSEWRHYQRMPKEFLLLLLAPFVPANLARCFVFMCDKKSCARHAVI